MNSTSSKLFVLFWLPFGLVQTAWGYDGYSSCSKPYRSSRSRDLPCDFKNQNWCIIPGSAYPWHAVRRFVFENHGLMKRMYGEQRHISVLRAEIETNDIDYNGFREATKKRFEKPTISLKATTASTTTTATTTTTTSAATSTNATEDMTTTTEMDDQYLTTTSSEEGTSSPSISSTVATRTVLLTTATATEAAKTTPQIFQETAPDTEPEFSFKFKGINACPVKEEVVAPFWANNTRGEILALLNLYPFEQYVHWERCTYENKQMYCRQGCRCEQQYRLHRLLAYDPTNDCRGIFSDWFKFPSCCVCKCYDIPADLRPASRSPRAREPKISVPASWTNN